MTTTTTSARQAALGAADAFVEVMDAAMRAGADLLDALQGGRTDLASALQRSFPTMGMTLPRMEGCCAIPPPCWMPEDLGEVRSHVCPGATATLRVGVRNCGATARTVEVEGQPKTSGVVVTPTSLVLGPMERGIAVASLAVPATAGSGEEREALLWVRGCRDHVLRWSVRVAGRGADSCHEVDVEDCPDPVHHWYDHFYCERPCTHRAG